MQRAGEYTYIVCTEKKYEYLLVHFAKTNTGRISQKPLRLVTYRHMCNEVKELGKILPGALLFV